MRSIDGITHLRTAYTHSLTAKISQTIDCHSQYVRLYPSFSQIVKSRACRKETARCKFANQNDAPKDTILKRKNLSLSHTTTSGRPVPCTPLSTILLRLRHWRLASSDIFKLFVAQPQKPSGRSCCANRWGVITSCRRLQSIWEALKVMSYMSRKWEMRIKAVSAETPKMRVLEGPAPRNAVCHQCVYVGANRHSIRGAT